MIQNWIRNNKLLTAIILVAVLLRIGTALFLGNEVVPLPGTTDQVSYHNLAIRLINGHGFSFDRTWWPATAADAPTAHWSFLYTFYLAAIYLVFGPNALIARLIQALIVGLLHPYLAYRLGKTIFNKRVGLIVAAITAIYTYFVYYSATLMTEAFYITAILGTLNLVIALAKPGQKNKLQQALLLGVILGITVLLRQLFLLAIPFLFLWFWYSRFQETRRLPLLETAVPALVVILMVIPFTIFNYSRFDRFVLLNTNAGYAFYWANHPVHGTHFIPILPPEMGTYRDLIPPELRRQRLDEAALDSELLSRAFEFIIDDPGRYVLLSISRIPAYFVFWPTADSELLSNLSRLTSFTLFLPFMLYGIIRSIYRQKLKPLLAEPQTLLLVFALVYTAIHLLSWALIRYRLPVDAVLVIFTASGILDIWQRLEARLMANKKSVLPQE